VLIHTTDLEAQGSENGTGDRMDVTNLSVNQYRRQQALGCPGVHARTAISGGNITNELDTVGGLG
jgi:hypothetical protein